jgi:hypothetical protein
MSTLAHMPAFLRNLHRTFCVVVVVSAIVCVASCASSSSNQLSVDAFPLVEGYEPRIGHQGKDSVWVPTPNRLIERMLQMADTTECDVVIDLGSGDGRIPVIAAKRFGARGVGVELDADLVRYSIALAAREGVAYRATFEREDLFQADLSRATVIAMYISPAVTLKLRPTLLRLTPGTRVVSHQFTLGDWEPDETAKVENATAYLWVVPAQIAGDWIVRLAEQTVGVAIDQSYQKLSGAAQFDSKRSPLLAGRVRGTEVRFTFLDRNGDSRTLTGRISGDTMEGVARTAGDNRATSRWSASRR